MNVEKIPILPHFGSYILVRFTIKWRKTKIHVNKDSKGDCIN